jgi:hypothetical protein
MSLSPYPGAARELRALHPDFSYRYLEEDGRWWLYWRDGEVQRLCTPNGGYLEPGAGTLDIAAHQLGYLRNKQAFLAERYRIRQEVERQMRERALRDSLYANRDPMKWLMRRTVLPATNLPREDVRKRLMSDHRVAEAVMRLEGDLPLASPKGPELPR